MARVEPGNYVLSNNDTVVVRNAEPDDALAIIAVMRSVFEERDYHLSVPEDFKVSESEQRSAIERFAEDPGKLMLVAESEGKVVAILEFENDYRQRMQHRGTVWVSIAATMRGQDLGTCLGIHGWRWALENTLIEKVYMHVLETNVISLALCRKMGFQEEARLKREVKLGPGRYADVVILSRFVREEAARREVAERVIVGERA